MVSGPCARVRIQQLARELIYQTWTTCFLPFWWVSIASLRWDAVGGISLVRTEAHYVGVDAANFLGVLETHS